MNRHSPLHVAVALHFGCITGPALGETVSLVETMPEKADEMSAALIAYLKSVNAETAIPATPKKNPSATAKP